MPVLIGAVGKNSEVVLVVSLAKGADDSERVEMAVTNETVVGSVGSSVVELPYGPVGRSVGTLTPVPVTSGGDVALS